MKPSDHLIAYRFGYTHHGIFVGDKQVIHYTGKSEGGEVAICHLNDFCLNSEVRVKDNVCPTYSAEEIVSRAYSRLGEMEYNLFFNNCEHFVNWCIYGKERSSQLDSIAVNAASMILPTTDNLIAPLLQANRQAMIQTALAPAASLLGLPLVISTAAGLSCYKLFKAMFDD